MADSKQQSIKVLLVPRINCRDPKNSRTWYTYVAAHLEALGIRTHLEELPDVQWARPEHMFPWLKQHADDRTIVVGHCTGAFSALQFAQKHPLLGLIAVAPSTRSIPHCDDLEDRKGIWESIGKVLGGTASREDQYYLHVEKVLATPAEDEKLDFASIRGNVKHLCQLSCAEDRVVPFEAQSQFAGQHMKLDPASRRWIIVPIQHAGDQGHFLGDYCKHQVIVRAIVDMFRRAGGKLEVPHSIPHQCLFCKRVQLDSENYFFVNHETRQCVYCSLKCIVARYEASCKVLGVPNQGYITYKESDLQRVGMTMNRDELVPPKAVVLLGRITWGDYSRPEECLDLTTARSSLPPKM